MCKRAARGLTLVEMLAALAITGLIVAAVMPVTASLARSHTLGQKTQGRASLEAALRRILAMDLANARSYRVTPAGLELEGLATLEPRTLELQHVPSTVRYEVRRTATQSWLDRVQVSDIGGTMTELVCSGVAELHLTDASQAGVAASGDWQALPDAVTVRIGFGAADRAPIEFLVHRR